MHDNDHDKIIRVEEKLDALSNVVFEIKNNHLAHIADDIKKLQLGIFGIDKKLAMYSGGIVVVMWILDKFVN